MDEISDWITEPDYKIVIKNRDNMTAEAAYSIGLAVLSLGGIILGFFLRSWLFILLCGPICWGLSIIIGAVAILNQDNYGSIGPSISYIVFLGFTLVIFY